MSANIFSPDELLELTIIPAEINAVDLGRFFNLSPTDLSIIDPRLLRPSGQVFITHGNTTLKMGDIFVVLAQETAREDVLRICRMPSEER